MRYPFFLFSIVFIDFIVVFLKIKYASYIAAKGEGTLVRGSGLGNPHSVARMIKVKDNEPLPAGEEQQLKVLNVSQRSNQLNPWPQD
jgi:hypothetical protein